MARPRIFSRCPECGERGLVVVSTYATGHCVSRWCVCARCGAKIRAVAVDEKTRNWVRVRSFDEIPKKMR